MRWALVKFAKKNINYLRESGIFLELLRNNGEFSTDLIWALCGGVCIKPIGYERESEK